MFRAAASLIALVFFAGCASAQTTIERNFIPDASLDFPQFASSDDASTVRVDNAPWTAFLRKYVSETDGIALVDYAGVSDGDAAALDAYIAALEATDPASLTSDDQLAFWINLYNAVTVAMILDEYPLASIRDIKSNPFDFAGPWDDKRTTVAGVELSLNDIEHSIIRPAYNEPRIHYAVNCASIGCPNLRPEAYHGESLEASLDEQARAYISHPRGVRVENGAVVASKIFTWYKEDFGDNDAEILDHIRKYADADQRAALESETRIRRYEYDWSLNEKGAVK